MTLTPEHETAIREREAAATKGPWIPWDRGVGWEIAIAPLPEPNSGQHIKKLPEGFRTDIGRADDAFFIAHSRADIPALLSELDRVRKENEQLHWQESQDTGHAFTATPSAMGRIQDLKAEVARLTQQAEAFRGMVEALREERDELTEENARLLAESDEAKRALKAIAELHERWAVATGRKK